MYGLYMYAALQEHLGELVPTDICASKCLSALQVIVRSPV